VTGRTEFLRSLLGKPWRANASGPDAYDCYHLMALIQRTLAGRELGALTLPAEPTWRWMCAAVESHPARSAWRQLPDDDAGLVRAGDLAIVLLGRSRRPGHCGVWLAPEQRIIHADQASGVIVDTIADLHAAGWHRRRFYEPPVRAS